MEQKFLTIIGYALGVAGAVTILFSKVKTDNLKDLKERVEILEKELLYSKQLLQTEREEAHKQHVANREAIAKLQGQVEIYKDLQLKSIADTNAQILNVLQKSATAQKKSGVFVKTQKDNPLDVSIKE